ncbi:MAG: hypothetical protein IJR83_08335 [Clostridia bacterium]|nr:hypothetical protein [Clostridia bacterium]
MKRSRVFWGIVFILCAVGILLRVIKPELAVFQVPVWKWILGALLLYWLCNNAIFGRNLAQHLDVFFQLGLGYILFRPELAAAFGYDPKATPIWAVLLAAAFLHIANHLFFDRSSVIKVKKDTGEINKYNSEPHNNAFGENVLYLDAMKARHMVRNRFGETNIYFQNIDIVNGPQTVELSIDNRFGETNVHVPQGWRVIDATGKSEGKGESVAQEGVEGARTLKIYKDSQFGEVNIEL